MSEGWGLRGGPTLCQRRLHPRGRLQSGRVDLGEDLGAAKPGESAGAARVAILPDDRATTAQDGGGHEGATA